MIGLLTTRSRLPYLLALSLLMLTLGVAALLS
ncbi:hypothetical protein BH10PSE14_BH10PSE14_29550 [soil metagenome]